MSQTYNGDFSGLLQKVRTFVSEELYPLEPQFLRVAFRELIPVLAVKRQMVKDAGMWAPQLPVEYGGLGLGLAEFARISEEIGRTPIGHYVFNCQAPDAGNMEVLMTHATEQQKDRYLWPLVRGEVRSCFSMTEPEHAGSNPAWLSTAAEKD